MALTKLDPNVIGQDSTGASKLSSAGGTVTLDVNGNLRIANSTANTILFAANGSVAVTNASITISNGTLSVTNASATTLSLAANGTLTVGSMATFDANTSTITLSKLPKATGYNDITGANCNTIVQNGLYMGYNLVNGPGTSGWIAIEVISNGSDQVFQRATQAGYDGGRFYVRFSTNGGTSWSSWAYQGNYSAVLDYGWFYSSSKVDRWRGGIDTSGTGNSWTASNIQSAYGDSNEGYYSIGFIGHSEGLEVKNFGGSIGTVQWAHTYGSKPQYRNRTDNSSWGSWYQL